MTPQSPSRRPGCPATVELEYVAAGDSVPHVTVHLATCEACTAEVRQLEAEHGAFRAARSAEAFARKLERKAESGGKARVPRWRLPRWALSALGAGLLLGGGVVAVAVVRHDSPTPYV